MAHFGQDPGGFSHSVMIKGAVDAGLTDAWCRQQSAWTTVAVNGDEGPTKQPITPFTLALHETAGGHLDVTGKLGKDVRCGCEEKAVPLPC